MGGKGPLEITVIAIAAAMKSCPDEVDIPRNHHEDKAVYIYKITYHSMFS